MPTVVIAGGTSASLGRSLTTAILALTPHWHPVILSRHASSTTTTSTTPTWLAPLLASHRATLLHVNYACHASLVAALRGAHTVICVLGFSLSPPPATSPGAWAATQTALLAAAAAAGVARFAPAEFGVGVRATPRVQALRANVAVWEACERSGMEWTRFECGLFMNYLGFGVEGGERGRGRGREEALAGREGDGEWFYYASECGAEIPVKADGSFPRISMMAMEDVGRFVARSLDLPLGSWETTSSMVGETLAMDEVVRIAERVMGKKWEVKTVSPGELEKRIEQLDKEGDAAAGRKMWAQLGLCYTKDAEGEGWLEGRLNRLFPDLKPLSVEDYMRKYYS